MKTQEMCKGISKFTVPSLFVLRCPSVSSLDVSDKSLDRAVVLALPPLLKQNMQLYSFQLSKIQLLCNKVCKNNLNSARNVQRPVILPHRGGQAFLFH